MGMFREVSEGNFDNLDSKASQKMSQEVNQLGDKNVKATDKPVEIAAADISQAESAKGFSTSAANFRDTLTEQARATQETVLGKVQENLNEVTPEFVASMEAKLNGGKPIESLRMMLTVGEVSDNPIKAMSEINRMIMDVQKA